jgi:ABC-type spermidine/putrescine transport system permease subunit II
MPDTRKQRPAPRIALGAGLFWLAALAVLCIGAPAALAMLDVLKGILTEGLHHAALSAHRRAALARTLVGAGAVGAVALLLALPGAMVLSRMGPRWMLAAATPMLLPPYLAFAGWSGLRAPTTTFGRWIASAPERGLEWLPLVAARGIAVWGLGLWAWPLCAIVLALGLRAGSSSFDDALRLEAAGPFRRASTRLASAWPSVLAAWALASLLMLGSPIPFHVARIETFAIGLWGTLDQHPAEPWRAWVAAWPLVLLAGVAAWLAAGPLARAGARLGALGEEGAGSVRPHPAAVGAALGIPWALAVLVPLVLLWIGMGSARAIPEFLRRAGPGVATGLGVGAIVGLIAGSAALGAAHACAVSERSRRICRWMLVGTLAWSLLPGVLIGAAVAVVFRLGPRGLEESVAPVVVAHLSRWLFLPVLIGIWTGTVEARALSDARRLDGALGPVAWVRTAGRAAFGPAMAVALAGLCLSLHEIEASIQVQTPGIEHLAQRLLQWLHYEQSRELSAAGVIMLGLGLVVSVALVVIGGSYPGRTSGHPGR